jgi:hypothetical protein
VNILQHIEIISSAVTCMIVIYETDITKTLKNLIWKVLGLNWARGSVVVKALCCKLELRCFFFSVYLILPAALGSGLYSASNRNEYQEQKNNVSGE